MIDVVVPRVRRDHEQRKPWPEAAAPLLVTQWRRRLRVRSALAGAGSADDGVRQVVRGGQRRIGDAAEGVVIPAVGVVPREDHGGVGPVGGALERVDLARDELLLVGRVRIGGVTGLIGRGFQEADRRQCRRRQVAARDRGHQLIEVADVVLVVGRIELRLAVHIGLRVVTDLLEAGERVHAVRPGRDCQMVRVGRRGVVLERLLVVAVVVVVAELARFAEGRTNRVVGVAQATLGGVRDGLVEGRVRELVRNEVARGLGATARQRKRGRRSEPALEVAPRDPSPVQLDRRCSCPASPLTPRLRSRPSTDPRSWSASSRPGRRASTRR